MFFTPLHLSDWTEQTSLTTLTVSESALVSEVILRWSCLLVEGNMTHLAAEDTCDCAMTWIPQKLSCRNSCTKMLAQRCGHVTEARVLMARKNPARSRTQWRRAQDNYETVSSNLFHSRGLTMLLANQTNTETCGARSGHTSLLFVAHTTHSRNFMGVRHLSAQKYLPDSVHARLMREASGESSQQREPENLLHPGTDTQHDCFCTWHTSSGQHLCFRINHVANGTRAWSAEQTRETVSW